MFVVPKLGLCQQGVTHPLIAPLPENVLSDKGGNLAPFANSGAISQVEACSLASRQICLLSRTGHVDGLYLQC